MPMMLRHADETAPLADDLAALGRTRRGVTVTAGVFALLAVAVAGPVAAAVWDVAKHLPAAGRGILLAAWLGGLILVFVRKVRRPAREPADALSTAQRLEAEYPRLNDALASAVSFLEGEQPDDAVTSRRFRRAAVGRAVSLSARYDFDRMVPWGRAWRNAFLLFLAGCGGIGFVAWDPTRAAYALARFFDPFGSHPWPAQTTLELQSPNKRPVLLARGDAFDVAFAVRGVIPPSASVEIRYPGSSAGSAEPVPLTLPENNSQLAAGAARIDAGRVARDFNFRVTANDADTGWVPVRVLPPPKLVPLEGRPSPRVSLAFPAYTGLPPQTLPDGAGVVEAVAGTRVTLKAAADRRIVSAELRNPAEATTGVPAAAVAPLAAGTNPFAAFAAGPLAELFVADIPVRVGGPEGNLLEVEFVPPQPGLYSLRFTDEDGLTGVRLFDVRTFPDPAPTVGLERPAAGQDPLVVLPTSTITVRARAEDRVFAARKLVVEYRVNDGPFAELSLADTATAGAFLPAIAGVSPVRPQPVLLQGTRRIPLAAFAKPDGKPPADGDTVTLRAAGSDWDDLAVMKVPGRSKEITLQVLAPASFDALIQKELGGLRPDLARELAAQKEAAAKLAELAKNPPAGKPTDAQADQLAAVETAQKQLRAKLADPQDGARTKAENLRDLIRGNDLPRTPATDRAADVAKALARADDPHLQTADKALADAKKAAEKADPKAAAAALKQAAKAQQGVIDGLTDALERLEQWAGPGELRGDVRGVKDQANKAAGDAAKAAEKAPPGAAPDQLPKETQAAANQAADKFDKAADEAASVAAKAGRVADEKAALAADLAKQAAAKTAAAAGESDPAKADALKAEADALTAAAKRAAAEAASLKDAAAKAGGDALADDLRKAADAARNNRPGDAAAAKQSADARLDAMRDALSEKPPEAGGDELAKKNKQTAAEVEKLAEKQDELRKKAKAAAATPDPAARGEALKALAEEQEKLERTAEQLARKAEKDGNDAAAEQLKRAAEQMQQNRVQLEQGTPPADKQHDEALDRLDDAKDKLDEKKKEEQDQLQREKQEDFAKAMAALTDRQAAAVAELDRLQAAAEAAKRWDRPLAASLSQLEDREKTLAEEIKSFAAKNLEKLPVFDRMAKQATEQLGRAASRLRDRKDDALTADPQAFDAESERAATAVPRRPMAAALARLTQIRDAMKPDDPAKKKADAGPMPAPAGGGEPPPGGDGGPPPAGGVAPLAQLKALRDWQAEINEKTAAFAKANPDAAKLSDDEKDDLRDLEKAQKDVAELFEQLLPLFQKGDGF